MAGIEPPPEMRFESRKSESWDFKSESENSFLKLFILFFERKKKFGDF